MAEDSTTLTRIQPVKNRGGVWVALGTEEYRIPPLGFAALQELPQKLAVIQGMSGVPGKEQIDTIIEIVLLAIQRNYPDITMEELRDKLDMGNFGAVLDAVLNSSGYRRSAPGEATATSQ